MSVPSHYLLQSAVGREYGSDRHGWLMLDDLFDMWPHVMAALAILLTALNTYLLGDPHYIGWCVLALAVQLAARAIAKLAYRRRDSADPLDRWLTVFWFAAAGSGLLWGLSLGLLLVDATTNARVTILTVGCVMVQSASARAYMAPLPALTQSGLMLAMLLGVTVAQGDLLIVPICVLFVLFQIAYIRRLIGLRLGQMQAENEKNVLLSQLEKTNSELKHANERLARHALTDGLTGLPNRRHFDRSLSEMLARAVRREQPFSLVLIDVDLFKRFNDTYGHLAGDGCLTAVGKAMAEAIRAADLIARYGGEEFALLLPDTGKDAACALAGNLRSAIAAVDLSHLPGHPASVTASLGIATRQANEATSPEQLIARADEALYAAKHEGRDCVRHADDLPVQGGGDRLSA